VKTLQNAGHGAGLATTAGATAFAPFATTLLGSDATEANRQFKHREAGTVRRARVFVTANTSTGTSTVTLRKGGVDTALVVSIGALSTGWFEDTSNSVSVADGDLLGWKIIAGATAGPTIGAVVAEFDPTDAAALISNLEMPGPVTFSTASATRYFAVAGRGTSTPPTTEAHTQIPAPAAGTLRNLHCYVSANSRTQTTTIRTRKAGANGAQSLSIGSTATGLFEDTSNTDSLAQGDLVNVQMVTGTGTQTITIQYIGVTWESTARAFSPSTNVAGTANTTASITRYLQIGGDLGATFGHSVEANAQTKALQGAFKRLAVYVSANSRTTTTTVTTRKGGASQTLTLSIGSTATGLFEDTSNSFTTAADDLVNHAITFGTGTQSLTVTFVSVAFVPAFTVAIGQASETDSAQAVAKLKAKAVGQPSDTSTAQALTRVKAKTIGQPAEADLAQPIESGTTISIGQAVEVDSAQLVARSKTRSVGQASEVDAALAVGRLKTRSLAQATEADSAHALARAKSRTVGVASETGTAQAVARSKVRGVGMATEADLAQPLAKAKSRAVGQPVEADLAQLVGKSKARALGQALEVDDAQPVGSAKALQLGEPVEVDAAQPVAASTAIILGQPSETDTASAVGRMKTRGVGQAVEVVTPQPIARIKAKTLGQVSESDQALALARVKYLTFGVAGETDNAFTLDRLKSLTIGTATEVDDALPMLLLALLTALRVRTMSSEPADATASRIPALATSSADPSTTSSRHPALATSSSRPDLTTEGSEHAT
jgi:hypothetical protein